MIQKIKLGEVMEKIVEIKSLSLYKNAVRILEDNDIIFDKVKLLNNPELCFDIVNIFNFTKS
jgi:hypothetical protein